MTPLRLHGANPEQLREVAVEWWARPLAKALLKAVPGLPAIRLRITAGQDGRLVGRLHPEQEEAPAGWMAQVEQASQRLFLASADALDEDEGFWRAFSAWCPPEAEVDVLRFERNERDQAVSTWLAEPWCRDDESPAAARFLAEAHGALDPDVRDLLEGLEALNQRDALAAATRALAEALAHLPGAQIRERAARLTALLEQLS